MATFIEPYRKGMSFKDWNERLKYTFEANKIQDADKKAHFITLGGPVIFSQLRILFPCDALEKATYKEMVEKLKVKLDKSESDLIQRFRFNNRVQQPGESIEDFILGVKLQAEQCNFENFKDVAIRDRIVAGVKDKALQARLMNEENLTLQTAEKIVTTWEMAGKNVKTLHETENAEMVAAMDVSKIKPDSYLAKLLRKYQHAQDINADNRKDPQPGSSRSSIKSRLGYRQNYQPYNVNFKGKM